MGINFSANNYYGNGLSMFDWDNDGFDDLVLLSNGAPPLFYKNNNGFYTEVIMEGINIEMDYQSVNWVDINNDGLPDISFHGREGTFLLYKNLGNNTFSDITLSAGTIVPMCDGAGHSWGDYNNDGFLDLYVCNFENPFGTSTIENYLFRNNGDFTFTDVTLEAGVGNGINMTFQSVWFDYDKDGWLDLYLINDRIALQNYLYRNLGDGTFEDVSVQANVNAFIDAMSATVGDYNNDGWLDIYVTNGPFGNILHRNNGDGTFTDVTGINNLGMFRFCWGAVWIDYDGDMLKDLYVGTLADFWPGEHYLFLNRGAQFDRDLDSGVNTSNTNGFATSVGDVNNDGYPDLVVHNGIPSRTEIWVNEGRSYNYLKVRLQGTTTNRDGIGCWIEVYTPDTTQYHYTMAGEQYLAQNSQWKLFSTGRNEVIDSLKIRWQSGLVETYYSVPANQHIAFIEGQVPTAGISIQNNTLLCRGEPVTLDGGYCSSYIWSTGEETRYITVESPGWYYLSGINFLGELVQDTIHVEYLPHAILTPLVSPPSCIGFDDGTIQLINTSEVQTDSVIWSNNFSGLFADNLSSGIYNIMIYDEYGCSYEAELALPEPDSLNAAFVILQAQQGDTCSSNWDIEANVQGGTPPYQYLWQFYELQNPIPFFISELNSLDCISASNNSIITLTITDANECSFTVSEELGTFVTDNFIHYSKIQLYPNPTNQFLRVDGVNSKSNISIHDIHGKLILELVSEGDSPVILNTTQLTPGIYLMRIQSNNSHQVNSFIKY